MLTILISDNTPFLFHTFLGILVFFHCSQGEIQEIFLSGGTTEKRDNNCDQALTKSSWGSV